MADGSITFSTALDNGQLEKQLQSLSKRIGSIEDKISQKQAERAPLAEQSKQLAADLDAAKARLEYMKSGQEFFTGAQVKTQTEAIKGMESDWSNVQGRVERYDTAINNATLELDRSKEKAGAIAKELAKSGYNADAMDKATKRANKSMGRFVLRVREVVRSALVFTLITQALAKFREWAGKVIKTNAEASAAVARLKGALLTMAQPLVSIIIPAFTAFVNILTRIISTIAQLFAMLTGKSIESSKSAAKALNEETEALNATGAAAKEAGKSMAGFDEINKISSDASSGGGSAGSGASPDFAFDSNLTDGQLQNILDLVLTIGAALLAWKIGSALQFGLVDILALFAAIVGAIALVRGVTDAWVNGVNWGNLIKMVGGLALVAIGLAGAFGKAAAAVALIVGGAALFITAIHDMTENGMNLQNTLLSIAGLLAAGLGIAILTGSWIPLLISGVLSALTALVYFTGHGGELIEGLKTIFQGFSDLITALVNGDIKAAGEAFKKIWEGVKIVLLAVWDSIVDAGKMAWVKIKEVFAGVLEWVNKTIVTPISNAFRGFINGLLGFVESFVNFFIGGINDIISAINSMIQAAANALAIVGISVTAPQIPTIPEIAIPRLATGAVIPPNREFLAVLGDQKSGTNIEAPLDTIVQAVMLAMAKSNNSGSGQVIENAVYLDGEVIYRNQKKISKRHGVNLTGR